MLFPPLPISKIVILVLNLGPRYYTVLNLFCHYKKIVYRSVNCISSTTAEPIFVFQFSERDFLLK